MIIIWYTSLGILIKEGFYFILLLPCGIIFNGGAESQICESKGINSLCQLLRPRMAARDLTEPTHLQIEVHHSKYCTRMTYHLYKYICIYLIILYNKYV